MGEVEGAADLDYLQLGSWSFAGLPFVSPQQSGTYWRGRQNSTSRRGWGLGARRERGGSAGARDYSHDEPHSKPGHQEACSA